MTISIYFLLSSIQKYIQKIAALGEKTTKIINCLINHSLYELLSLQHRHKIYQHSYFFSVCCFNADKHELAINEPFE